MLVTAGKAFHGFSRWQKRMQRTFRFDKTWKGWFCNFFLSVEFPKSFARFLGLTLDLLKVLHLEVAFLVSLFGQHSYL